MAALQRSIDVLLVGLVFWLDAQISSGNEASLPDAVRRALADNAEQASPVSVSLVRQYSSSLLPGELMTKLGMEPAQSERFLAKTHTRVIWQDGKMYSRTGRDGDPLGTEDAEISFDGRILYTGSPNGVLSDGSPQASLMKQRVSSLTDPQARYIDDDYFDTCGLRLPVRVKDMQDGRSMGMEILLLLESGARLKAVGETTLAERSMTRVEVVAQNPQRREAENTDLLEYEGELRSAMQPESTIRERLESVRLARALPENRLYVFYLDPQRNYAVQRREERYEDGTLLLEVNNSDFEQLQGRGIWLPHRSVVNYYTWVTIPGTHSDTPILSYKMLVSGFDLKAVPDNQFALNYRKPGTRIFDYTVPGGALNYEIPADEATLNAALETIQAVLPSETSSPAHLSQAESNVAEARSQGQGSEPLGEMPLPIVPPRSHSWMYLVLLNGVALIALGCGAVWRHRHRSAVDDG